MKQIVISFSLLLIFGLVPYLSKSQHNRQENPCYFDKYSNNESILKTEALIQAKVTKLKVLESNKAGHDSRRRSASPSARINY